MQQKKYKRERRKKTFKRPNNPNILLRKFIFCNPVFAYYFTINHAIQERREILVALQPFSMWHWQPRLFSLRSNSVIQKYHKIHHQFSCLLYLYSTEY